MNCDDSDSSKGKQSTFYDKDNKGVKTQENERTGKEIAIQTNVHEIERSSGQLPLRKRFVPLKFSDYCVFANNVKEEDEEEVDVNFAPNQSATKQTAKRDHKQKKSRGRPRKYVEEVQYPLNKTECEENESEKMKKHSITRVSSGFKCGICNRIFTLRGNAKAHLITHTDRKPFLCDFKDCGKSLRTKESLRRHKMSHLGIKIFECTECHKSFSCNLSLQEHMNLHTGEKPLKCDICGLKFRQIAVLKRHLSTHSNNKPFECEVCGKKFSQKVYVRSHMKTHTGERPFACDICNKCFAHASDLNRHKIIHSGKKPYECSVCSLRYSDPSSRRRHEREHQSKQQYECHLCKQQFPRAGQLRVHLVKEHSTTPLDQNSFPFIVEVKGSNHQISNEKDVASITVHDGGLSNIQSGSQAMVMEIPRNNEEFTGLPINATYKVINSDNGNQVFEFQMDNDSQIPLNDLNNEVKIKLPDIDVSNGLVTFIQNGDTVTILEQNQTVGQSQIDLLVANNANEDYVTRSSNEKVVEDCSNSASNVCVVKLENEISEIENTVENHPSEKICENDYAKLGMFQSSSIGGTHPTIQNNNLINENHEHRVEVPSYPIISSIFIDNPDLSSQDYYDWLSTFSEECKHFSLPLSKEVFQKISHVQKTLSDFMAMPTGVITDKNNFKILMGITQDLSQIISSHLSYMYSNLNK